MIRQVLPNGNTAFQVKGIISDSAHATGHRFWGGAWRTYHRHWGCEHPSQIVHRLPLQVAHVDLLLQLCLGRLVGRLHNLHTARRALTSFSHITLLPRNRQRLK